MGCKCNGCAASGCGTDSDETGLFGLTNTRCGKRTQYKTARDRSSKDRWEFNSTGRKGNYSRKYCSSCAYERSGGSSGSSSSNYDLGGVDAGSTGSGTGHR